ncbi:MAG: hypothetical protein ACYTF7_08475 [Planctomycetota bacterium]|jgi:hypothetical protein
MQSDTSQSASQQREPQVQELLEELGKCRLSEQNAPRCASR